MTGRPDGRPPVTIGDLLSYRLARTSAALSRTAAVRYRREFDVSLGEWRTMALVAADPSLTLNRLARRAGLDKAQVSRVVSKLVDRGLLARAMGSGRTSQLSLTAEGARVYAGLIAAANERDELFRSALTGQERLALDAALDKLVDVALAMERAEGGGDGVLT